MLPDSNIIISATFFSGNERKLIKQLIRDGSLVLAEEVITESERVAASWETGREIVFDFISTAKKCAPVISKMQAEYEMELAGKMVRDTSDVPILAAFLASGADYLVTGDKDLLSIGRKDIINARAALEILGKPAK